DGIRCRNVTGVQTCALPIFPRRSKYQTLRALRGGSPDASDEGNPEGDRFPATGGRFATHVSATQSIGKGACLDLEGFVTATAVKIGRASCRERRARTGDDH